MRLLIASMIMCCCAVAGYSQDADVADVSTEVSTGEDTGESTEVVVGTDSYVSCGGGCGCGNKPKI